MHGLYDINFKSNGEFCKIRIRYNVIYNWSTIDHLIKWSILEFTHNNNTICIKKFWALYIFEPKYYYTLYKILIEKIIFVILRVTLTPYVFFILPFRYLKVDVVKMSTVLKI
jgi:hypothetical protein